MGRVSEHLFCEKKKEKKKRKNYIILATRIFNNKKKSIANVQWLIRLSELLFMSKNK